MKFKVGDKVRIKRSSGVEMLERSFNVRLTGAVGTIARYEGEWRVILDDTALRSCSSDGSWGVQDEELELVVEPRFKVGDRVKVRRLYELCDFLVREGAKVIDTGVIERAGGDFYVRYDSTKGCDIIGEDSAVIEVLEVVPPVYVPRHTFVAPSPIDAISPETLDRWVDDGVKNVEAQKTLGYEHSSFTTHSGDTLLRIENGKAYLYRLEGTKDVE